MYSSSHNINNINNRSKPSSHSISLWLVEEFVEKFSEKNTGKGNKTDASDLKRDL